MTKESGATHFAVEYEIPIFTKCVSNWKKIDIE
jgi:hypothetical protein